MSRDSEIYRYLIRRPTEMVRYSQTGRKPPVQDIASPLITLLESIPPRDRAYSWRNIRLSPKLGYTSNASFATAEQMLHYLKPKEYLVGNESTPAESRKIKSFQRRLTLLDLAEHAAVHPALTAPAPR